MKLEKILMLTVLSLSAITGCSQNNSKDVSPNNSSTQDYSSTDSGSSNSPSSNLSSNPAKLDLSIYDVNNNEGKFDENDQQISWTFEDIELTAEKRRSDKPSPDSDYLGKIIMHYDGKSYTLDSQNRILRIQSVSVSKDHKRVAISLFNGAGSELNVVNLENGDIINLNGVVQEPGAETIDAYNWSPSDHRLAFSYGDTSSSSLGIFDADTNKISQAPDKTTYISTACVLWFKNGKSIDFISEKPSDQYKLYRYDGNNKVEEIVDISKEDLANLSEYAPNLITQ